MHTSLRQYRAVDAVARLGSFVEAAKALHVTPAALSSLVRELEKDLGFPVFERTTRKVRVSESGEQYLPHVHRVLAEVAGAERCALDVRSGQPHVIRLATTQTVITTLLPNAFRSFRQKWPQGRLYPLDILSGEIGDALQSGQADIAIGALLPSDERFDCRPFLTTRWHCCFEEGHPLARHETVAWKDIVNCPLIFPGQTGRLKLEASLPRNLRMSNVYEASTASAGIAMAASGQGIMISAGYVAQVARLLNLCTRPLASPEIDHELEICISARHSARSAVAEVRDLLLAEISAASAHALAP